MKVFLAFLVLFTLTIGLIVSIDYYMGSDFGDLLNFLYESNTELVGEDYVLIFCFTVPFGIAKIVSKYLQKQKKIRNQQQNAGQNTAK